MSAFSYKVTSLPIRKEIPDAFRYAWGMIAAPGCWWTGEQRIAIATETRRARQCPLCRERKTALSPYAVSGEHDHAGLLPPKAVEAAHRLSTDPARLKRSWYEDLLDADFTDGHYVEIVGIVTTMISIDQFHYALGLELEPLPEPQAGAPSGYRPTGAGPANAWVPMITTMKAAAEGDEEDIYPLGQVGNVVSAMSLVPDAVRVLNRLSAVLYVPMENVANPGYNEGRALERPQMEFIAARVSAINDCFY